MAFAKIAKWQVNLADKLSLGVDKYIADFAVHHCAGDENVGQ
jgi:hypothetical protein